MPRVPLSRLPDWTVLDEDQEIRGLRLADEDGTTLGLITDLIVDTEAGYVTALLLDTGTEIPADDVEIGEGIVYLRRPRARQAIAPNTMTEHTAMPPAPAPRQAPVREQDITQPFHEGVLEVRARAEQIDISKQMVVVEEIRVDRNAVERVETIQDTVRRTRVNVEQLSGRAGISEPGRHQIPRIRNRGEGEG